MTISDYLKLITSEHAGKPDFADVVAIAVAPNVRVQELLDSMIPLFDLSTPPKGDQLDIIGKWVGVSREVKVPIPGTGIWFSWDDTQYNNGWDLGNWQPTDQPAQITILPDDAYLTLILAKIGANSWNGTTEGAYAVWEIIFPNNTVLIQDHNNMSYSVIILGPAITALQLALLAGGYVPLKPEAIAVSGYYTATAPIFSFDVESDTLKGWDEGTWAVKI